MNTPLSPTYHLERCPPAAAHGSEPERQFTRHSVKVYTHASFDADGVATTNGLAFTDNVQIFERRVVCRRHGIPAWALSTAMTRAVLVEYFDTRAFGPKERASLPAASEAERLKRAVEKLRSRVPRSLAAIDNLCNELVALRTAGGDPARQRVLEAEIESLDTQVRMAQENWPAVVLAIVYRSYNLHENSVEVAQALHVKPPHVRQTLWRLNQTWKRMLNETRAEP